MEVFRYKKKDVRQYSTWFLCVYHIYITTLLKPTELL